MRLVEADMVLDGGTVRVRVEDQGEMTAFEFDDRLPWDGRPRHISISDADGTRAIAIGSEEEKLVCFRIERLLENEYGEETVRKALQNSHARDFAWKEHCARQKDLLVSLDGYNDPHPLPFRGMWISVFEFVKKAYREGKR